MSGFSLGYTERLLEMTIDPHGYSRPQPPHVDPTWSPGRPAAILATLIVLTLVAAQPADAYIGPGAGFALLSSFLVLFTTLVAALASLLFWPFRMLWRRLRGGAPPRARIRRLVIVGFDGQDPELTDRFMEEGLLPNFKRARGDGLLPPAADDVPVGVAGRVVVVQHRHASGRATTSSTSSIAIGAPTCRVLSSAHIGKVERFFKIGRYRIPLRAARAAPAAEVEAVLDDPRRAPHLEHRSCACRSRFRRIASTARS